MSSSRLASSTDGLCVLSSVASIDSLDEETDTLKEEDDSSIVNSCSTAAAAVGGRCEGIEDIDSLGEIIDEDSDEDENEFPGPDVFVEEDPAESCLAYRAPWATPPTATLESHGPPLSSLCKLRGYACITSPPLSLRSPDLTDTEENVYPRCRHNASWETTSATSYMEQLLRDGGDLDSMDRSLLDYAPGRGGPGGPNIIIRTNNNGDGAMSPPGSFSPPYGHQQQQSLSVGLTSTPPGSPMTPLASPANGSASPLPPPPSHSVTGDVPNCNNAAAMSGLVKKDLVVRFTEFQNSVQHVTSATQVTRGQERPPVQQMSSSDNILVCRKPQVEVADRHVGGGNGADMRSTAFDDEAQNYHEEGDINDDDQLLKTPDESSGSTNLYLYHDDFQERPHISKAINALANYSAAIPSGPADPDAKPVVNAQLGTIMGVFFPCIQNIFGVILFIRLTWVVGTAGAIEGTLVVLTGCTVTMTTAISMGAIATNGVVPGGGSYFMISRSLGPEFGGAVGILFYLGTTIAGAMYIIGAVEILITYLVGQAMSIAGPDIMDPTTKFNNYRMYGTVLLIILGIIVFIGVKFVNKFASVALFCVLATICSIYIGIFVNFNGNHKADFCVVGTRIVEKVDNCTKEFGNELFRMFCLPNATVFGEGPINDTTGMVRSDFICDPYYEEHEPEIRQGIRGLASSSFFDNAPAKYRDNGDAISNSTLETEYNLGGKPKMGYITTDIYTSFVLLIGIFFPSCTGIMAGSNRSGDLADPQKSIPIGTIAAIIVTSTVYLSSVLLFAGTVDPMLLRDKFGQSIGGSLVVGNIAWPHPKVVEIGALLSTIGAGLQSLTGAPRLLQAIAKDGIIPFLKPFEVQSAGGEPIRALGITLLICEVAVLIGNVDEIAPLLSMFFLMCYGFVNLACALQTLLKTPNWRPRFKYYHWSLSVFGVCLSIAVMFMSSWYYALLAMGIAGVIYKYIEYCGAEKEWGDGLRGVALSAARFSLLRLEEGPPHTKNWRPQVMVLAKLNDKLNVKYKKMFQLASQLKAGKGLTIGVTVIEGTFSSMYAEAQAAKVSIRQCINEEGVKGFPDVVVSKNISDGICHLIQTAGLGGMKPNTIVLGWPNSWRKKEEDSWRVFVDTIRNAAAAKMALLVPKGIQRYPDSGDKVKGNIDVWWIVHDGGLLMLLPFLLKQHRTWKNCKLRIFSVAQETDNSIQMKKDLKTFLYQLRIEAEVDVVELHDSDISDYTYERTLLMEQRNEMLKEMQVSEKRRGKMSRRLSLTKQPMTTYKVVDDMIIQADAKASDLEVEKIVTRQVESVLENSRRLGDPEGAEGGQQPERSPSKVTFSEEDQKNAETKRPTATGLAHSKRISESTNNIRRMHTAVRLNEAIVSRSHEAKLVILNLPSPPKTIGLDRDASYMEFLEVLTEGLERILMIRGGGREVITIYS